MVYLVLANLIETSNSICTLCGKPRIVSETWLEKIETHYGFTQVTHTTTICPDPECQKKVDIDLAKQKQHRDDIKKESELRKRH